MQSSWRGDLVGGATTFATLSYILFVNPAILSDASGAKMDPEGVLAATAIASAASTLLMGFAAGYPIALAPGMGLNAFFSFTLCGAMGLPWQTALGMVFVSGALFLLLTLAGLREKVLDAIPRSLQFGTAAGIGLFLAFLGFQQAGWVRAHPVTMVALGDLSRPAAWLAAIGLAATVAMLVRRVPGAILWGILATGAIGLALGIVRYHGILGSPPSLGSTLLQLDVAAVFTVSAVVPVFTLLYFDFLDTLGTLVGVGEEGGFLREGRLPRARRALAADATGTMLGALLGTSTIVAYIESAAGVAQGARTWRANVVVAALLLVALFFAPLFRMLGEGVAAAPGSSEMLHPVTAPAVIVVGSLMAGTMAKIDWRETAEAFPAFLTMVAMPLTFSIADGLAMGFIAASAADVLRPDGRRLAPGIHVLSLLFLARYVLL